MPVVAHFLGANVAFTRGPVLLARDNRFGDGDIGANIRLTKTDDGRPIAGFTSTRVPTDDMWMAFSASLPTGFHETNPEGAVDGTVFFCDYASAGNGWNTRNYYRTWFPTALGPADR